jgi:polyhydroxybutyrate depolymerase
MIKLPHVLISAFWGMVLCVSLVPFVSAQPSHANLTLGSIRFDDLERTYYLHLSPNYESSTKLPVVFVLHGGGKADGDEVAERTGYMKIADRENFVSVYPNGVDSQWNDGRGKTFRRPKGNTNVDDVGFISALIDHLIRDYKGDPRKIYVTGLSNGGMMTLRLGCEISSKLAAIAPVIANMPENIVKNCKPDSPLPVLLMNGTEDPLVPWNGGSVKFFRREMGEVVSTAETMQFWVKHNQCNSTPEIVMLPNNDRNNGSRVQVSTYTNNTNGAEAILYTIMGGGHSFPGSNIPNRPRILGKKNNDINGSEIIWKFFKQHVR